MTSSSDAPSLNIASPEPSVGPQIVIDSLGQWPRADFWEVPGDFSAFFGSPSIGQDQLSGQVQLQELFGADDNFDAMLHMDEASSPALNLDVNPLTDYEECVPPLVPLSQDSSAANSLASFREGIDQSIATIESYYLNPSKVLQRCKDDDRSEDVENPAALLLTRTREFIDIIQRLMPADVSDSQSADALGTEVVLLVLSSYLSFMRFFDALFYQIYTFLCEVPPETYETTKVKSVLRIGGVSSLQDISLKAYAIGILDSIYSEVQILERRMGIPVDYCISGQAALTATPVTSGIFSSEDRARLFWAVMEQNDVKARRGGKSYAESARASIQDSMAFLDNETIIVPVLAA